MGIAPGESPDDLARVVDGKRPGVEAGGQGIVDRGEGAAAQQEAMGAAGVGELADDPAQVVDVERERCPGGCNWVVDGGEDVDWHVVGLLVARSVATRYSRDNGTILPVSRLAKDSVR